jgi:hypothetical protein
MRIFLICPVRNASCEQLVRLNEYIHKKEAEGHEIYYPARDTDQNDNIGFNICYNNADAIRKADEIHIFYDSNSQGSLFDLGVAFALYKKLVIVNKNELTPTEGKSFINMILQWEQINE